MNSAVRVKDTSPDALRHVFANLRECDRAELDATNYSLDPDDQTERLMGLATFQFAAYVGETPAAIIGAWPRWPGVWGVYAFGTDEFPGRSLTKFARRVMVPALLEAGAHRAECASLGSHWRAHQWLERLGAKREAILRGYGKNRETFYLYAWTAERVQRPARGRRLTPPLRTEPSRGRASARCRGPATGADHARLQVREHPV